MFRVESLCGCRLYGPVSLKRSREQHALDLDVSKGEEEDKGGGEGGGGEEGGGEEGGGEGEGGGGEEGGREGDEEEEEGEEEKREEEKETRRKKKGRRRRGRSRRRRRRRRRRGGRRMFAVFSVFLFYSDTPISPSRQHTCQYYTSNTHI